MSRPCPVYPLNLVIILTSLLLRCWTADALTCVACDPATCDFPDCTGGMVRDACDCCHVCAKQELETCGGMFDIYGQCDKNLTCIIQPTNGNFLTGNEEGTCKRTESLTSSDQCHESSYFGCNIVGGKCKCGRRLACSNPYKYPSLYQCNLDVRPSGGSSQICADVRCEVQHSPNCPDDSILVEGYAPPGECCPMPSRCECRAERCAYNLCPPDTERTLVRRGNDQPGTCCDIYMCNDVDRCEGVRCSFQPLTSITCPSDSIAVRDPAPTNQCCPGDPICQCRKDRCSVPVCSAERGQQIRVAYRGNGKSGSCCDEFTCASENILAGCSVNGTRHEHGTTYQRDGCRVCECKNGVSYCSPTICPKLTCTRLTMNRGACCPECLDDNDNSAGTGGQYPIYHPYPLCKSNDGSMTYAVGETWSTDACTHCTCEDGGITRCKAAFCQESPVVTITTPTCPSMSGCLLRDGDCPFGFQFDEDECKTCSCKLMVEGCSPMDDCAIDCPRGYMTDDDGCNICQCRRKKCKELTSCMKQCPYGYKQNKKGCDRCKCRRCPPMESCDKECKHGLVENKYGCPVCKCRDAPASAVAINKYHPSTCVDRVTGHRHDEGETWSSDCYICVCRGGDVMCDVIKCPVPRCDNPVMKDGDCCASCPDYESTAPGPIIPQSLSCQPPNGDRFVEGETWSADQCTSCTCHSGHVMCMSTKCPPTPCDNPIYDDRECCPKCIKTPDSQPEPPSVSCIDESGLTYEDGEVFQPSICSSCVCRGGTIKCYNDHCPQALLCDNPVLIRGQCCPQCLGMSAVFQTCDDGEIREHADQWNKTSDVCISCACIDGAVHCVLPTCKPIPHKCHRVYRRNGACCDECVLEETGPPYVSIPKPVPATSDWVPLALGISISFVVVGLVFLLVAYLRRTCLPIHSRKYTPPSSPTMNSDQSRMMVSCSLRSGSVGTARTVIVSTSSEDERMFTGEQ